MSETPMVRIRIYEGQRYPDYDAMPDTGADRYVMWSALADISAAEWSQLQADMAAGERAQRRLRDLCDAYYGEGKQT